MEYAKQKKYPEEEEKCEECDQFTGMKLDTIARENRLHMEKLERFKAFLKEWKGGKEAKEISC